MPKTRLALLYLSVLLFINISCTVFYVPQSSETSVINLDSATINYEDSVILAMINPYKTSLDSEMNEIIGYSEKYLTKELPEGLLNNFIADIVLVEARRIIKEKGFEINADISLLNNGGLRAPIPSGAVTTRNIFELMPFDNQIFILELSGKNTKQLFNFIASSKGLPLAGAKMGIKDDKAVDIFVNNVPFDESKNYCVVTSDYLANGGDKMSFFNNPVKKVNINYLVRDAIIFYIKEQNSKGKVIDSKLDKRIYFE